MRHFLAIERVFERCDPEVVVPEVGNETHAHGRPPVGVTAERASSSS